MSERSQLIDAFRAHATPNFALDDDALGRALSGYLDAARDAWPQFFVEDETFAAYLAQRVSSPQELTAVQATDLYLACACAQGKAPAISAFEEAILAKTSAALQRMDKRGDLVDEIQQIMRAELLVGTPDDPPKIVDYLGKGSLLGWVKVASTRRALKSFRKDKREVALQEWDVAGAIDDGELGQLRTMYQREFRAAFETAFGRLSSEQRNLLRLHIIDELSIDAIAKVFQIHRATAARRLGAARVALAEETRDVLSQTLGAGGAQINSILGLVRSRLDLSIRRILAVGEID